MLAPPAPAPAPAPAGTALARHLPARRRISSRDLLAGALEVEIEHQSQVYRLRQTALGKLILTK